MPVSVLSRLLLVSFSNQRSRKIAGLGFGFGLENLSGLSLEASGLDHNTGRYSNHIQVVGMSSGDSSSQKVRGHF